MAAFRFVPFSSVYEDGTKTSRKKMMKSMAEGGFYPGEGAAVVDMVGVGSSGVGEAGGESKSLTFLSIGM